MRFVVRTSALDGDDVLLDGIDRLVDRLADEVHRIEVPEADLLPGTRWYRSARATRRKVLTSALANPPRKAGGRRGLHTKTEEISDADSAQRGVKLAYAPLVILVEDREADGVLLEIVVEELGDEELRALWARGREVTPRAFEIATAGGIGSMPQRVERTVESARRAGRPVRLFVLCDSDARWPRDRPRSTAAVKRVCDGNAVPCHVWRKRSAENYIPDESFESKRDEPRNRDRAHRFDALLRRSPVQRDHFPIKTGLKRDERQEASRHRLYDAAEASDLAVLEKPLFPPRPRILRHLDQEHRSSFTAAGLRQRDGEGELDQVLQAIAEEL